MENKGIKGRYYTKDRTLLEMMNSLTGVDEENKIVVPNHQRNYVWNDADARDLLRTLVMGYPLSSITANHIHKDSVIELQDGLQRHFSIRRLFLEGYRFLNREIILAFTENEYEEDDIKHVIKHLNSKVIEEKVSKVNIHNYVLDYYSEDLRIFDKDGKEKNKSKEKFDSWQSILSDIKEIIKWITNVNFNNLKKDDRPKHAMLSIEVAHIYIEQFNEEDIKEVFSLLNTKGKNLTGFEKKAAEWAKNPIELSPECNSSVINSFQEKRKSNYYSDISISMSRNPKLINYSSTEIMPSNYVLAIINETIGKRSFAHIFLDENGNLKTNAEEAAVEIVKYSLADEGIYDLDMMEFGNKVSSKVKDADIIDEQIKNINNAINTMLNHISIFKYGKGNIKKNFSLNISSWLLAIIIITLMKNESSSVQFYNDWFIYESLYSGHLKSGTKEYSKKSISQNFLLRGISSNELTSKQMKDHMKKSLENEKIESFVNEKVTRFTEIIISLVQGDLITLNSNQKLQLDHFIPKKTFKNFEDEGINMNTLFNMQLLESEKNNIKSDRLSSETLKDDFIYKWAGENMDEEYINDYDDLFVEVLLKSYHYEVEELVKEDGSKEYETTKVKATNRDSKPLINFLLHRQEAYEALIKSKLPRWFKQDN